MRCRRRRASAKEELQEVDRVGDVEIIVAVGIRRFPTRRGRAAKKEIQERLPEIFNRGPEPGLEEAEKEKGRLERKVGELTMDLDWLKKKCKQFHIPLDEPK